MSVPTVWKSSLNIDVYSISVHINKKGFSVELYLCFAAFIEVTGIIVYKRDKDFSCLVDKTAFAIDTHRCQSPLFSCGIILIITRVF